MLPTASDIAAKIHRARECPHLVNVDDLRVLAGALLLCLRVDDNGVSKEYALLAEGRDLQQDVAESLANLPILADNPTFDPLLTTFERDQQFYEAMHALLAMTIPKTNGVPIKLNTVTLRQRHLLARLAAAKNNLALRHVTSGSPMGTWAPGYLPRTKSLSQNHFC